MFGSIKDQLKKAIKKGETGRELKSITGKVVKRKKAKSKTKKKAPIRQDVGSSVDGAIHKFDRALKGRFYIKRD